MSSSRNSSLSLSSSIKEFSFCSRLLSSFLFNDSMNKYEFHIDYYTKITNPIPLLSFLLLFKFDLVCTGCAGGD